MMKWWSGWKPLNVAGSVRASDLRPAGEGYATGLHLSTIIRAMKEAAEERVEAVEGDQPEVRLQEGFLWEVVVEYLLAGVPHDTAIELAFKRYGLALRAGVVKQLRLERDGIQMTPDALDPAVPRIESYKATRRTLRRARTQEDFEANFWTWLVQEGSYCHAAGVPRVRWIVWWIAGDYSRGAGSGPRMLESEGEFDAGELERMWAGVVTVATRLREGKGK